MGCYNLRSRKMGLKRACHENNVPRTTSHRHYKTRMGSKKAASKEVTVESSTMTGIPKKQCPVCEKVLSKSNKRYHIVRLIKTAHGIEGAKTLLKGSSRSEALDSSTEPEARRKGPFKTATPMKSNIFAVERLCQSNPEPRNPVKLLVTASEAKNVPDPISECIGHDRRNVKDDGVQKESGASPEKFKSAGGPHKPTRPELYDRKPRPMSCSADDHPKRLEVSKSSLHTTIGGEREMEEMNLQGPAMQTPPIDWKQIGREVEFLVRLYRLTSTIMTPEKLFELGRKECPNLEPVLVKHLVAAHYPMGRYP